MPLPKNKLIDPVNVKAKLPRHDVVCEVEAKHHALLTSALESSASRSGDLTPREKVKVLVEEEAYGS
jgi:hypothetical protein